MEGPGACQVAFGAKRFPNIVLGSDTIVILGASSLGSAARMNVKFKYIYVIFYILIP